MKKIFLFLSIFCLGFSMISCGNGNEPTNPKTDGTVPVLPEPTAPTNPSPVTPPQTEPTVNPFQPIMDKLGRIDIEVEETYNISSLLASNPGVTVNVENSDYAKVVDGIITGLSEGVTKLVFSTGTAEHKIELEVHQQGALGTTFTFDEYRLAGKSIVAFGDSVTDYVTNRANSYYENFAEIFGMNAVKNYAIGGTTAHYGYAGSNLYNEYFNKGTNNWIVDGSGRSVVDGPQRVKNAYTANELNDIDYVFIAYGHNDQYFQPVPTQEGYDDYNLNSFASCASFKGSYIYMINTIKLANPNARIIILGPTYSMYDVATVAHNGSNFYGKEYNYSDYAQVLKETAAETNCRYVNSWNYLKDYWDYDPLDSSKFRTYYNDIVHLSKKGQQVLAEYMASKLTNWYLNGSFAYSDRDADYQFAKIDENKVRLNLTVTKNELNIPFDISNGEIVLNSDNLLAVSKYLTVSNDNKISFNKEGEYVIEITTTSNDVRITKKHDPVIYYTTFDSSSPNARIRAAYLNEDGKYEFDVDFILWGSIQINYNGQYLSTKTTTFKGEITNEYPGGNSTNLYTAPNTTSTFICPTQNGANYTFIYDPVENTLEIKTREIVEDDSGLTYTGTHTGVGNLQDDGTYVFEVKLALWNSVLIKYNGIVVTLQNTDITGNFVGNVAQAPYTTDLYMENGLPTLYSSFSGINKYTFTYTPATETEKAKLVIYDNIAPVEIPKEGLYIETLYNETTDITPVGQKVDGNTATVTFAKVWGWVRFYYNGELLTTDNTTFVNVGSWGDSAYTTKLYVDSNDENFKNAQLNFSYSSPTTYTFTYDPEAKTVTVVVVQ